MTLSSLKFLHRLLTVQEITRINQRETTPFLLHVTQRIGHKKAIAEITLATTYKQEISVNK